MLHSVERTKVMHEILVGFIGKLRRLHVHCRGSNSHSLLFIMRNSKTITKLFYLFLVLVQLLGIFSFSSSLITRRRMCIYTKMHFSFSYS